MFLLFMPLAVITIILSIIFSLLAYTNRNHSFFIVGLIFSIISGIMLLFRIKDVLNLLKHNDLMAMAFIAAWLGSIVFLVLSKSQQKQNSDDGLADSFLDSIIDEPNDDNENDDEEYIFSFSAICKHLNLDPAKTRHAIMNATHRISTRRRAA